MSLLEAYTENFVRMVPDSKPDGSGGTKTVWADGEAIRAAVHLDVSTQARIAEAAGAVSAYTVTTPRAVHLKFHDILKRARDGKTFRITSDNSEKQTPALTALDMAVCTAEEWRLPT